MRERKIYHNSLARVLQIILMMDEPRSVKYMAKEIGTSERTIYRYMVLLEEAGFQIDKKGHRFEIVFNPITHQYWYSECS